MPRRLLLLLLLLLLSCVAIIRPGSADTYNSDVDALKSLMNNLKNTPPSWNWKKSGDPCGASWDGVSCNSNGRVTSLKLFSMGLEGTLSDDIGMLDQLQLLDLSYNQNLKGPLTPAIGKLTKLYMLFLIGCNFQGSLPAELGNLVQLIHLALNSNQFTGEIPSSLGKLSNLYWLDLADNQLNGKIPTSPGLDQLLNTRHFHFNENHLSGPIPENLFSANMSLLHVLFDRNEFSGGIPESVGLVNTLEILCLDNNKLNGTVPFAISNLTNLQVLRLANNSLTGPMPNLTGMNAINYVDLSNNSFDPSEAPSWFSSLQNMTALLVEYGQLRGQVPKDLFSLSNLQIVMLNSNTFNGTLDVGNNIGQQLQIVNLQNNTITSVALSSDNSNYNLLLAGNPVCRNPHLSDKICQIQLEISQSSCSNSIECSHPYVVDMIFRAPSFGYVTCNDITSLVTNLITTRKCAQDSLTSQDYYFDGNGYLVVQFIFCPSDTDYFDQTVILDCFDFSGQTLTLLDSFGPYYFDAQKYSYYKREFARKLAIGLGVTVPVVILVLVALGICALRQRKRAQKAISMSNPFASWVSNGEDGVDAPQLRGAKCFTYDELRESTDDFQEINEIGSGGYGKVYRGMLPDGQLVAIKRCKKGSSQGGLEFKTEIEMLSRVHHKNLVGLVGFCCEKGELMLVYEFICNGTLRDCLSGKSGIHLHWSRRLKIALDSATGLAYLHEHANPPIIHRDVKSTNILLDENLTAKVADFGLSLLVSDAETGLYNSHVKGTPGYLDPEYYMTQQLTGKSDVYSLGVVMLELISAMPALHDKKHIIAQVKLALDEEDREHFGLKDLIDPFILEAGNLVGLKSFLGLALQCVKDSADDRPTMSDVAKEIETILRNSGMKTTSIMESSPGMDLKSSKARNQYDDSYAETSSSAFAYSGRFTSRDSLMPSSSS